MVAGAGCVTRVLHTWPHAHTVTFMPIVQMGSLRLTHSRGQRLDT